MKAYVKTKQQIPNRKIIGIDVGGSGIKAALVNTKSGILVSKKIRLDTPKPANPENIVKTITKIINIIEKENFNAETNIGIALPTIVKNGVAKTATNISNSWINLNVENFFSSKLKRTVYVTNDADAAGISECHFGAAKNVKGTVLLLTLGTGIGSALIANSKLVPNIELGHIYIDGQTAESQASESARNRDKLNWEEYAKRLQKYFEVLETIITTDLIIIGGGISKEHKRFLPLLNISTPIVAAKLRNNAGIIGAALLAAKK